MLALNSHLRECMPMGAVCRKTAKQQSFGTVEQVGRVMRVP
jgi:hypothetical protein